MKLFKFLAFSVCVLLLSAGAASGAARLRTDTIKTSAGSLDITFLGRSSLRMRFRGSYIYIDPSSVVADFSKMPKADIVFIVNQHKDNFDVKAIKQISNRNTLVVIPEICAVRYREGLVMKNGDFEVIRGLRVRCVPAYNIVEKDPSGFPYNFKGIGNGYVIGFADKRVYFAGDTEKIPAMNHLGHIDVAFLPVAQPDAMTPEMALDAVEAIKPAIFYPYRYGNTDIAGLKKMLKDQPGTRVRIRNMK